MTDEKPGLGLGSAGGHTTQPVPGPYSGGRPPFPPMPPNSPAVQPNPRSRTWLKYGAVALVSLLVGVGMGASGDTGNEGKAAAEAKAGPRPTATVTETAPAAEAEPAPTVTETVTETVTAKPKKTKEPGPATSFSGEGEYLVGEDIKAGTYKTSGPEDEWGYYWERAKDASGEFGSIIANNNLEGTGRVTLNKGEYFKTNRCQEWKRVG
ncbi:hypothetical protein STPH2_0837 [Streptomyces sp. KO7888]|uniref:hypothetical protein n=1 Tax=Streptomyces sp. KO7888 TaxID=2602737 RepID=UPI0019FC5061|nr:hypothetical protein [Streptomyces sp. KO7888]NHI05474.1 hypothetical protein [Streptomyces sp. KO7888]